MAQWLLVAATVFVILGGALGLRAVQAGARHMGTIVCMVLAFACQLGVLASRGDPGVSGLVPRSLLPGGGSDLQDFTSRTLYRSGSSSFPTGGSCAGDDGPESGEGRESGSLG